MLLLFGQSFALKNISGADQVSLYGVAYDILYIGSNGYITFGAGDDTYVVSDENYFILPRVAMLYTDLDPSKGGRVSFTQLDNRVAVTYHDVPHFSNSNILYTAQCEMFFDGTIQLSWLNNNYLSGIVGLSEGGGVPADFVNSDLSTFAIDIDSDGMPDTWEATHFGSHTNCIGTEDSDLDGFDNQAEYICDTLPNDPSSFFCIGHEMDGSQPGSGVVITWNSVVDRKYSVFSSDSLTPGSFTPVATNIVSPQNSYTSTVESVKFFKVEVEMDE